MDGWSLLIIPCPHANCLQVYQALSERFGLNNESMVLNVFINKMWAQQKPSPFVDYRLSELPFTLSMVIFPEWQTWSTGLQAVPLFRRHCNYSTTYLWGRYLCNKINVNIASLSHSFTHSLSLPLSLPPSLSTATAVWESWWNWSQSSLSLKTTR